VFGDLGAYFAAYAAMTVSALLVRQIGAPLPGWLLASAVLFVMLQAAVPLALWRLRRLRRRRRLPGAALLVRYPRLRVRTENLHRAVAGLPDKPLLLVGMTAWHACIIILDAATLWTMLLALGLHPAFAPVFASFVLASAVMSVSPVPLGLGTFEASCVALLHGAGIGIEAGLTATLLLRGTTTWLPMLPGLCLLRREMRSGRHLRGRQPARPERGEPALPPPALDKRETRQ